MDAIQFNIDSILNKSNGINKSFVNFLQNQHINIYRIGKNESYTLTNFPKDNISESTMTRFDLFLSFADENFRKRHGYGELVMIKSKTKLINTIIS